MNCKFYDAITASTAPACCVCSHHGSCDMERAYRLMLEMPESQLCKLIDEWEKQTRATAIV